MFLFQTLFPDFFLAKVEDEYYESLTSSTFLDTLEEAHIIDLNNTTYQPSNEVMSLNPFKYYPYYKPLSLVHPKLII